MNLIDHLLSHLGTQRDVLLRLQALSQEERTCLLNSRLDRLEEITAEQQVLLTTQAQLSHRITNHLERLGAELQLSGRITLSRIAETITGPQAATLQAYYREITEVAEYVQREGRVNWYLSQQALKYVDFTLKLLGRVKSGPALYTPRVQEKSNRSMQLLMDSCA